MAMLDDFDYTLHTIDAPPQVYAVSFSYASLYDYLLSVFNPVRDDKRRSRLLR